MRLAARKLPVLASVAALLLVLSAILPLRSGNTVFAAMCERPAPSSSPLSSDPEDRSDDSPPASGEMVAVAAALRRTANDLISETRVADDIRATLPAEIQCPIPCAAPLRRFDVAKEVAPRAPPLPGSPLRAPPAA